MVDTTGLRRRFRGYSGARPDVMKLIEGTPRRVLDVGCGAGMAAAELASRFPGVEVIGVEPDPGLASVARQFMGKLFEGHVDDAVVLEQLDAAGPYDLILCADVLEHVADPWHVLSRLAGMLAPDGAVITSIPNVRHISTFLSLGIVGHWPERDRGIHDRGHLRYFARPNILKLGQASGLCLDRERRNLRLIESAPWSMVPARILDFWPLRSFLTFQYLHRWRKKSVS